MRRRNHPDIDVNRLAADPVEFLLLQDAQQLDLHFFWHFADFIQKQRTGVRLLQVAEFAFLVRAGEGPRCITEQFAFKQTGRNRAAIDRDKLAAPPAGPVDGAGEQFLAAAALAAQHDRYIGGRNPAGHANRLQHQRTMAVNRRKFVRRGLHLVNFFAQTAHFVAGFRQLLVQINHFGDIPFGGNAADNLATQTDRLGIDQDMRSWAGFMIGFSNQQTILHRLGNHQVGKKLTDRLPDDFSRCNSI